LDIKNGSGKAVQKKFERKPEGSRRGRPRMRWLEDLEKNLWEMKVKIW
jgi:hypothetical protein